MNMMREINELNKFYVYAYLDPRKEGRFQYGTHKTKIAKLFNVSRLTVFNIITGKTYINIGVIN